MLVEEGDGVKVVLLMLLISGFVIACLCGGAIVGRSRVVATIGGGGGKIECVEKSVGRY